MKNYEISNPLDTLPNNRLEEFDIFTKSYYYKKTKSISEKN